MGFFAFNPMCEYVTKPLKTTRTRPEVTILGPITALPINPTPVHKILNFVWTVIHKFIVFFIKIAHKFFETVFTIHHLRWLQCCLRECQHHRNRLRRPRPLHLLRLEESRELLVGIRRGFS